MWCQDAWVPWGGGSWGLWGSLTEVGVPEGVCGARTPGSFWGGGCVGPLGALCGSLGGVSVSLAGGLWGSLSPPHLFNPPSGHTWGEETQASRPPALALPPPDTPPSLPRRCCGGFWGAGEGGLCPPVPLPGPLPTRPRLTWPGNAPKPSPPSTTSLPSMSPPRRWDPSIRVGGKGGVPRCPEGTPASG